MGSRTIKFTRGFHGSAHCRKCKKSLLRSARMNKGKIVVRHGSGRDFTDKKNGVAKSKKYYCIPCGIKLKLILGSEYK